MPAKFVTPYLLAATVVLCLAAPAARADNSRIVMQTFNPAAEKADALVTLVANGPGIGDAAKTAWDAVRGRACEQVLQQLPQLVRRYHASAKVVNPGCKFNAATTAKVTRQGSKLTIDLAILRNSVGFKVEAQQKVFFVDVVPDARIDVPFDLSIRIVARTAPATLLALEDIKATVSPGEPTIQAQSLGGGLVLDAARFLKINVSGMIRDRIGNRSIDVGTPVEAINRALSGQASRAIADAASITLWGRGDTTVFAILPRFNSLPRGPVSGIIAADIGNPDCAGVSLKAIAKGPGKLTDPFSTPAGFLVGSDTSSSRAVASASSGAATSDGVVTQRRQCGYRIADAPLGSKAHVEPDRITSRLPAKVPSVAGNGVYRALPANNVNFTTGWGFSASADYLESRFPGQKVEIKPLDTRGGPVVRDAGRPVVNGRRVIKTTPKQQR